MTSQRMVAAPEGRRIVVKIGSRSLVGADGGRFAQIARQVLALRAQRRAVILVSSGAIALGRERLGLTKRPTEMAMLQACAAIGQSALMRAWEEAFGGALPIAQLLLTHSDLADRDRYLNARAALDALQEVGALPILNENDTVAVDEIRFGDNDQLAAMVATLAGADLLVLLTDVEGLLDADGTRVPLVEDIGTALALVSNKEGSDVGTGGMGSKLEAARRASRLGVPVLIADARDPEVLTRIARGEDVGTLVPPAGARLASRKHWIAFTLRPKGSVLLDAGAAQAIRGGGSSLLPAGVVGVRGDFGPGDAIVLTTVDGTEIARGLARYGTRDVARLAGAKTVEIGARLGFHGGDEIVHRDDLVLS